MNVRAGLVVFVLMLGFPAGALACPDALFHYRSGTFAPGDSFSLTGEGFDKPAPSVSVTLIWRSRDGAQTETLATVPIEDGKTLPATTITIPSWAGPGDTLRGDAYDETGQLNGLSNGVQLDGFREDQPASQPAPTANASAPTSTPTSASQAAPANPVTPPQTSTARQAKAPASVRRQAHRAQNASPAGSTTRQPQATPTVARAMTALPHARPPAQNAISSSAGSEQTRARGAVASSPVKRPAATPALAWAVRHDDASTAAVAPAVTPARRGKLAARRSTAWFPAAAMLFGLLLLAGGTGSLVLRRRRDDGPTPDAGIATAPAHDHVELELQAMIVATPATEPSLASIEEAESDRPLALADA